MRSFLAALRTLVLPYGTTTGRRIVLDGINGIIDIFNSSNNVVVEIGDPPTGNPARGGFILLYTGDLAEDQPGAIYASHVTAFNNKVMVRVDGDYETNEEGALLFLVGSDYAVSGDGATIFLTTDSLSGGGTAIGSNTAVVVETEYLLANNAKAHTSTGQSQYGALPAPENWTAVTYTSPWASFGAAAQGLQYRKTVTNELQMSGVIKSTAGVSSGSAIATLPTGYRPVLDHEIPGTFNNPSVAAKIKVTASTGVVDLRHFTGPVTVTEMGIEFSIPLDTTK